MELNNGVLMPWLGFGTFQSPPGQVAEDSVLWALQAGYRHIDTAALYKNEADVGKAIRKSGIPRDEIFVTTKVWNADMRSGKI
ncbi:MAG TPA: aldo/keto reductase, partial [Tepidisphaeraceae bacterium]